VGKLQHVPPNWTGSHRKGLIRYNDVSFTDSEAVNETPPRMITWRSLMTVLALFLLLGSATQTRAFSNGQSPALVIGQMTLAGQSPATSQNGLDGPASVAFDKQGNMWVSDTHNCRVLEFRPPFSNGLNASIVLGQGDFSTKQCVASKSGFSASADDGPGNVVFDSGGNLWVGGQGRVLEFVPPFVTGMSASLIIGQKNFTSLDLRVSRSTIGSFAYPYFDPSGDLWVLDSGNNRVLEFKPPFSSGMNSSLVIGQQGFTSDRVALAQSGLDSAQGDLAVDPSGNVWVGDNNNNRILEFSPPFSDGMNATLVIGQKDFVSGSRALCEGCAWGFAIAFDSGGNLWVSRLDRVLEFRTPFHSGMNSTQASLEIGQKNFTSLFLPASQGGLNVPEGVGFDSSGNVWVTDGGNNRILEFTCGESCPGSPVSGQQAVGIPIPLQLLAASTLVVVLVAVSLVVLVRKRGETAGRT